jgi:cell division protein ZipA
MSDANILRLVIAVVGALILAAMYFFSRPKSYQQGHRTQAPLLDQSRKEPTIGRVAEQDSSVDMAGFTATDAHADLNPEQRLGPENHEEERAPVVFDRVIALTVAARSGEQITGPELVVAAEKIGLVFGERQIFHRFADGKSHSEPIFSMANRIKPGSFDMSGINQLRTSGLSFFMAIPGPLLALDAWDVMLPAAQRMAELLDAQLLDAEQNALGRQTIQHIRDELRVYDRAREKNMIKRSW